MSWRARLDCRYAHLQQVVQFNVVNNVPYSVPYSWLDGIERVGITSGASAPEQLVQETVNYFSEKGAEVTHMGFKEGNVHFALPGEI